MKFKIILMAIVLTIFTTGCASSIDFDEAIPIILQGEEIKFHEPLYHLLDTNGNQTGSTTATGDYSASETKFFIKPDSDEIYSIERVLIHLEDVGGLDANKYGNNIILTNGIVIYAKINGVTYNLTNSHPIKTNTDYGGLMFDTVPLDFGIGDESLNARFTFGKAGQPLILVGSNGDELGFKLKDDFTGLVDHHYQIQGKILSNLIYTIQ